uniref:AMP-binding protein n=1 Tax=uncultured Methanobrevibacter sp. TaxID=253161 RepID=UPI0025E4FCF8
ISGCYASFSFIVSFRMFASLYFGETCRLFNEKERGDSLLVIKALKNQSLNDLILPPSLGLSIVNEDINLKYMLLAGAKFDNLPKEKNNTQLANLYGTTETHCSIVGFLNADHVTLGKPIANTWAYILDENKKQVPVGVAGNLYISRNHLSPGYYNRPDLTNEVFVENPHYDCKDNKKMYNTGDIAFYNFDGEIEIIGREDNQLSVRGFRVESDEILKIMHNFDSISNIYLDVDNDNLIAYYTTNQDLNIDEVKNALKNELPPYMIPSIFIKLDEIPLNINGKIDKFALKKTTHNRVNVEINDKTLKQVIETFMEVLNLDYILMDDDFVSLGGNSLSAMKLQLLLKEKLDYNISSNEIMELSTPLNITNHIKFNLNKQKIDKLKYAFDKSCPLSESQLNVYLDEKVNKLGTRYNNPFKIELNNEYSIEDIKIALKKLFELYPVLSSRINNNDTPSFTFDAKLEIIEGTCEDIKSFVQPFDLDKCLSHFLIVKNNESTSLYVDFHHLIMDGTSADILLNKLLKILKGFKFDSIDNGILRQVFFEKNIDSRYMDDAEKFFDKMLTDTEEVSPLLTPIQTDNSLDDEFNSELNLDVDIESFLKKHGLTHNQFFCSVFAYTLSRFTGSSKVLFNLIEDGRGHIDLADSVGMYVRTLPLLMNCENQNISSFLDYSSNLINLTMKYDLYPFRLLANKYDLNSNILFQYSHEIFKNFNNQNIIPLKHDYTNDISFYIFNSQENKFGIRVEFSDKYSKEFIEHFVESYKLILKDMLCVNKLGDINYTSSADIKLLDGYNKKEHEFKYKDILDAFNDNLKKYEDNILVGYGNKSYTYGKGAFIANEIASKLNEMGVVKQDFVGLFVNRSEWYLLASIGVLAKNAIYVPIETTYPDERIILMLEDSSSRIVIVDDNSEKRMLQIISEYNLNIDVLNVSSILDKDIGSLNYLNTVPTSENDVACVLYTSGTTGTPKGVLITRKAINNFVSWYVDETNFTQNDVYGMYCSYVFDMHTHALYSPVITGGSLYIVPEDIRLNLKALNDYFVEHNCTHTYITSQVGKLFAESGMKTTIKLLCFGGMKLGELNAPDSIGPFESYGPSENLAISTSIFANKRIHSSSIGNFISNVKGYVLDNEHRRVPLGAVGELYLSGHQLTPGYLNRDQENENTFFNNIFDDEKGYEYIYKTGDIVRFLPDGTLGIVGRRDSQVKIRLNDYISSYVSECKPDYMVPSYVIELDHIPLNVNGKVDKKALPEIDINSLCAEYVAPTNPIEQDIVEAFEKVFNQEKISIHDDFIRLGGDSLTAIKLISHLENYNITAADILTLHTPHVIAENLNELSFDSDIYSLDSGCPLSEPQLNVYLDIIANAKKDAYLIPLSMEISNVYDSKKIYEALETMIEVHPILGMCVSDEFEVPYLIKGSQPPIILKTNVDEDYIKEFLKKPFNMYNNLCRFLIIENEENYQIFVVFHHIIFDGFSDNIFKRDLEEILNGKHVEIDDSFLKVSAFTQSIQNTEEYDKANNFYQSMLADYDEVNPLLDSVLADGPGIEKIRLNLDSNLLKSFLNKYNISENILFTSVFAYTLSRFVGSDKVLFNIIENGRDRFNNFNSIGMYVNTLPLLIDCKNTSISSFMDYTSNLVYNVMKYNYYAFRLLAHEYDLTSNILFQFIPEWIMDGDGNSYLNDYAPTEREDLISDLSIDIIQKGKEYDLIVEYSDKYSNNFIKHLIKTYDKILQEMLNANELKEINYISKDDINLLDSYNQTEHELIYDDILDAFNDNLSKYPNNKLVSFKDISYTYAEGAYIAKQIADKLKDFGIKQQDYVAFLVEPVEYIFCILGVLSYGAVYIPLNSSYPDDHIDFILKDTSSKAIIVDDNTYERAKLLADDSIILNISDVLRENIKTLPSLPVVYNDLGCILYTSGTTGLPKGVKVPRTAFVNLSDYYVRNYALTSDDVFGQYSSISFDAAYKAIFGAVYVGACLDVIPSDVKLDMDALNNHFIKQGINHVDITTQVAMLLISQVDDIPLDVLFTGGEKLGEFDEEVNCRFVDGYGPTEAYVEVSTGDVADRIDPSSIGHLVDNIKAYVLDDEFRRVPVGAVGELYLSGYQVADGYLNHEKETLESFLNNPFTNHPDYNTMYRTGDIVRILPDGTLGIVGRRDSQVKIRGNRVELTEVESAIRNIDEISD